MRAIAIGLVAATLLAGCGPTPEQKAAAEAEAKMVEAARLRAEAEAAREKEDAPIKKAALKAVSDSLRDPSSAQFRNVSVRRSTMPETADLYSYSIVAVCGEVNGKNAYGGYVGFLPFGYIASEVVNGKSEMRENRTILVQSSTSKEIVRLYESWC